MGKKKSSKKTASKSLAGNSLNHGQFRQGGVVSVFLGQFESEEELDTYLSEAFPIDFGFVIDPRDAPESFVSSDNVYPVRDILEQFSDSAEFAEPVADALAKAGWHRITTAVVFYNFSYDPGAYQLFNAWGKLKFVGKYLIEGGIWLPFP